jgi:hypothetical protein
MNIFKKRMSINKEIKSLLTAMKTVQPDSEEYAKIGDDMFS